MKAYRRADLSKSQIDRLPTCPCCEAPIYVNPSQSDQPFAYCGSSNQLCEVGKSHALFFVIARSALGMLLAILPLAGVFGVQNICRDSSRGGLVV